MASPNLLIDECLRILEAETQDFTQKVRLSRSLKGQDCFPGRGIDQDGAMGEIIEMGPLGPRSSCLAGILWQEARRLLWLEAISVRSEV